MSIALRAEMVGRVIYVRSYVLRCLVYLTCVGTSLCAIGHADALSGITIPLQYHPQYGIYTAALKVGKNPLQTVEAIVDTGSSMMVFVADKDYCPNCGTALTKGTVNPLKIQPLNTNKALTVNYGSAHDTVIEYDAPIQYDENEKKSFVMKVFMLKDSNQPSSVIGMIEHNLRFNPAQFTPFLVKMTENFNKYSQVTFILCADKGKSYFHVGPIKLSHFLVKTKLLKSQFYEINSSGFYDDTNKSISKPKQTVGRAILDTGTGGFILMTPTLYKPLLDYLFMHAGIKNQQISQKFWHENYCVLRKSIDFNALPLLKIGLVSLNDNRPYYLNISPATYINQAGCGEGYVRLVFDQNVPSHLFTALRNQHARVAAGSTPDMVIGTSLFENYAITISYKPDPSIAFYDNKTLCSWDTSI